MNGFPVQFLQNILWELRLMQFLEQQYIEMENVLSYKARVDVNRLGDILKFAENNIDALGLDVTGNILFTVNESHKDGVRNIMDIEILVPVNKAFKSSEQYIYKPSFKLVNAVSVRYCGLYSEVDSASCLLMDFLRRNDLQPISGVYYKVIENSGRHSLDGIFDAFISVNVNRL